jgi:3-methyladenine DNA glycosylase AlkD
MILSKPTCKMIDCDKIFKLFYFHRNPAVAQGMSAYMRDKFKYLGIPTPLRRELSKEFLKTSKKDITIDWDFIFKCFSLEREFCYLALDYLALLKHLLTIDDISKLKDLALNNSWWDSIDSLDGIIGDLALKDPRVNPILLKWADDEDIWLRRIAIDHQRHRKDKTDSELLEKIISCNLNKKEFFINKAIGWSLREYSKTNPLWVRDFIAKYQDAMAPLSIKEASKYL